MSILKLRSLPALALLVIPLLNFAQTMQTADTKATKRTRALFYNLQQMALAGKTLFGHEDAVAYGIGWQKVEGASDVKTISGSHPAVYGWDLGEIGARPINIDTVAFEDMKRWTREAYKRGGIHTISWHMRNPLTGGDSWDTTSAVKTILPGGSRHEFFKTQLDHVAEYMGSLKSKGLFGHAIPVIFRPWHEMNGRWFWWGRTHCTPEEYKALFRFTVDYLRHEKDLHNILFAYAPDVCASKEEYLLYYPGDDYADLMGIDIYEFQNRPVAAMADLIGMVVELAEARGKIPAFTETGFEGIPKPDWWTTGLLTPIKTHPLANRIAYLLVWRNARENHCFAPYPGHPSERNFLDFVNDPNILLENDLPDMYRMPKKAKVEVPPVPAITNADSTKNR